MTRQRVPVPFRRCRRQPRCLKAVWDSGATVARVALSDLYAIQSFVFRPAYRNRHITPPVVARFRGRLFIQDGHHRLARLKWRGARTATVLLYDLSDDKWGL